jgi:hypothetical protein
MRGRLILEALIFLGLIPAALARTAIRKKKRGGLSR